MPNITIEYVILIPLLFTQVIVFPLVANTITSSWQETQRTTVLQGTADHLASTVQQLYLNLNQEETLASNITHALRIPATIDSYPYTAVGSLSSPYPDSTGILTLTLTMESGNEVTAVAVMGSNVIWTEGSVLQSNSADVSLNIQKFSNSTVVFSFGG